jgi:hypothetical protein
MFRSAGVPKSHASRKERELWQLVEQKEFSKELSILFVVPVLPIMRDAIPDWKPDLQWKEAASWISVITLMAGYFRKSGDPAEALSYCISLFRDFCEQPYASQDLIECAKVQHWQEESNERRRRKGIEGGERVSKTSAYF